MNFDFSEEHKKLRDEARRFLKDQCPPSKARRVLEGGGSFDRDLWHRIADLGWTGLTIPESLGGSGLGHLALCLLNEEVGRAVAPLPFTGSVYLATEALLLFGSKAQQERWLPGLASGQSIGCFACSEGATPLLPARFTTRVEGGRMMGRKTPVADGDVADFAIVAAIDDASDVSLHLVVLGDAGILREPATTLDPSRSHASLVFRGAAAEPLPGAVAKTSYQKLLDRAAIMLAFEQVGTADAALDMARNYALNRYAFGRSIGSFQAIKHKLAQAYLAVELARSSAYFGAWALDKHAPELPVAASSARIAACDAGWTASRENIQTHGGVGYTWDMDCHLYYRRAKLHALALGSAREWKRRLMTELTARDAARRSAS